jgi:heme A synthase
MTVLSKFINKKSEEVQIRNLSINHFIVRLFRISFVIFTFFLIIIAAIYPIYSIRSAKTIEWARESQIIYSVILIVALYVGLGFVQKKILRAKSDLLRKVANRPAPSEAETAFDPSQYVSPTEEP